LEIPLKMMLRRVNHPTGKFTKKDWHLNNSLRFQDAEEQHQLAEKVLR
jgi:hypothetical protein